MGDRERERDGYPIGEKRSRSCPDDWGGEDERKTIDALISCAFLFLLHEFSNHHRQWDRWWNDRRGDNFPVSLLRWGPFLSRQPPKSSLPLGLPPFPLKTSGKDRGPNRLIHGARRRDRIKKKPEACTLRHPNLERERDERRQWIQRVCSEG